MSNNAEDQDQVGQNSIFISKQEAAKATGVSQETLMRFVEVGYLKGGLDQGQNPGDFFRRDELSQFFNAGAQPAQSISHVNEEDHESSAESSHRVMQESGLKSVQNHEAPVNESLSPALDQKLAAADPLQLADSERKQQIETPLLTPLSANAQSLDQGNLIEAQEQLLAVKERELDDLKAQRDWLKQRVEAYEEQSNRDKVLLLSEIQNVSQLLNSADSRRSPLQVFLEVVGLAAPKPKLKSSAHALGPSSPQTQIGQSQE